MTIVVAIPGDATVVRLTPRKSESDTSALYWAELYSATRVVLAVKWLLTQAEPKFLRAVAPDEEIQWAGNRDNDVYAVLFDRVVPKHKSPVAVAGDDREERYAMFNRWTRLRDRVHRLFRTQGHVTAAFEDLYRQVANWTAMAPSVESWQTTAYWERTLGWWEQMADRAEPKKGSASVTWWQRR
jgi:hypothetical protein